MKRIEDTEAFLDVAREKERRSLVRDLTDALEDLFMIPEGRQLAFRLGYPRVKSNRESLRLWVESEISIINGLNFDEVLTFLEHELHDRLTNYCN